MDLEVSQLKRILIHRKITLFILSILVVFSVYSYFDTPKQESPNLTAPYAVLTTIYPGASIASIEELVTTPIEQELFGIDGFDYSTSYTSNNVSVVVLALDIDSDLDKAYEELAEKMTAIQRMLPEGCGLIDINDSVTDTAGLIISLSSDNYSYDELADYAKMINEKISRIDGIRRFEVVGAPDSYIEITINEQYRQLAGISYDQLSQLIMAQTMNIPLGEISEENETILLSYNSEISNVADLESMIIGINPMTSMPVYLKDIGTIEESYANDSTRFIHNGKKSVILAGYFQLDQNILNIGKNVKKTIQELEKQLPSDIIFEQVSYLPDEVDKSINDFLMSLGIAVLLVIFVVFIGMGFRNAIIVSVAIPVSILMTVLMMPLFSIEIHQISIAACIIALGMLVDNAIVVSDAIQVEMDLLVKEGPRHVDKSEKIEVCVKGTKAVMIPVLTSTLTTIAAFSPLLFLSSIAGAYVEALPQIVIISLVASYLVAIFITPALASLFFKPNYKEHHRKYRLRNMFTIILKQAIKRKYITFASLIVVLVGAVFLALQLNIIFFPKVNKEILYVDVEVTNSRTLDDTQVVMEEVNALIASEEEVIYYTTAIGNGLPRFYDTLNVYTPKHNFAQVYMSISLNEDKYENNTAYLEYLQDVFDQSGIDAKMTVKELEYIDPRGSIIGVRISGKESMDVESVAIDIFQKLKLIKGAFNVNSSNGHRVDTLEVIPDKVAMAGYNLMNAVLQNELNIALMGRDIGRIEEEDIDIRLTSSIDTLDELEVMSLKTDEQTYTLGDVATIVETQSMDAIKKYNGLYSVYVGSDVTLNGNRGEILKQLEEYIDSLDLTDVQVEFEGENEKIAEYFGEIGILAIYAAFGIYIILLIQFKSFAQPVVILATIPLATIGSIIGLYVTKQPISFTAALGIVSLMGIVVNNAIVLLDFIRMERDIGKTVQVACIDAVQQRFRPIMLSTITTIIGLIPLAVGKSDLFKPMAVALMSGLIVSTVLTLIIIPVIYSLFIRE